MLSPLILLAFFSFPLANAALDCGQKTNSCAVSPLRDDITNDVRSFQQESVQKMKAVLNDKGFQDFIAETKNKERSSSSSFLASEQDTSLTNDFFDFSFSTSPFFYVFVSFSMGEKALMNVAKDAKHYGATLVLRGFKEESYTKTAKALQKIIQKTGQGFIIDPEFFTLFAVTTVPTIVLSKPFPSLTTERVQTPIHDRLQGHVSIQYALEVFAKEGDLNREAKALLTNKGNK